MKMNLGRSLVAAVSMLSAGGLQAQNTGFYFKADLGGNITQDIEVKEFLGVSLSGAKLQLDPGFRAGLGGGYQFTDWFAAEAEVGFMGNEIKGVKNAFARVHDATFANVPFLVNAKFQLPLGRCPVTPYAGAGVGFSESIFDVDRLTIEDQFGDRVSIEGSDSDAVFAWQAFAGLRYALNERMGLSLEYRYFEAGSPSWQADFTFGTGSDTFKLGRTHTHAFSVAFDYHF